MTKKKPHPWPHLFLGQVGEHGIEGMMPMIDDMRPRGDELPRTDFFQHYTTPWKYAGSIVLNAEGIAVATTDRVQWIMDNVGWGGRDRDGVHRKMEPEDGRDFLRYAEPEFRHASYITAIHHDEDE